MKPVPLFQANRRQCRWFVDAPEARREPRREPVLAGPMVCGVRVVPGASYCLQHHAIVYPPVARPIPKPARETAIQRRERDDDRTPDLVEEMS